MRYHRMCILAAALMAGPALAQTTITFDDPLPAGYTLTGGLIVQGALPDVYAMPKPDPTNWYLAAEPANAARLLFDKGYYDISFLWGTNDSYNDLDLLNADHDAFANISGSGNGTDNGWFVYHSDTPIYGLRFVSADAPAFEVDDITTSHSVTEAVPETATWTMMVAGFGLLGLSMRRRTNTNTSFA